MSCQLGWELQLASAAAEHLTERLARDFTSLADLGVTDGYLG